MSITRIVIATPNGVRQFRVRPWHRWFVAAQSLGLDAALAAGRSPDVDRWLALRAATLVARAFRERTARDWSAAVERAEHPVLSARVQAGAVVDAGPDIAELVARLRAAQPVSVRGMAHLNLLLTDGRSPVHRRAPAHALAAAIQACLRELEPAQRDYELSA